MPPDNSTAADVELPSKFIADVTRDMCHMLPLSILLSTCLLLGYQMLRVLLPSLCFNSWSRDKDFVCVSVSVSDNAG